MGTIAKLKPLAMCIWLGSFPIAATAVQPADTAERVVDRIHSNLPLYTFDWDQMWPRGFQDGDDFGCTSLVPFGDWQLAPDKTDKYGEEAWYRFENYGVYHCAAIMRRADDRAELEKAQNHYGYFVRIGKARTGSVEWDLWALQSGTVPGSDYVLMAREAGKTGRIEDFVMLQQRCPPDSTLEAKGMDIWNTRYCSINSREELLSLSRQMLELPPVGVLKRVTAAK